MMTVVIRLLCLCDKYYSTQPSASAFFLLVPLCILSAITAILFPPFVFATDMDASKPVIGIVYRDSETGRRYLNGIQASLKQFNAPNSLAIVQEYPYADSIHGAELLTDLISNSAHGIDFILGPTESDVFLKVIEKRSELETFEIPVISSLVTADVPHVRSGWFFLSNVDINRRAQTAYDFLSKYWLTSIAVMHANTEFGRSAERAFRAELKDVEKQTYTSTQFDLPATNARSQVRRLLDQRPEAIGIFGEREDLEAIYSSLKQMNNSALSYYPILFTVVDARSLHGRIHPIHFVSTAKVMKTGDEIDYELDEVWGLAYDTATLILEEIQGLKEERVNLKDGQGRRKFRDRFEAILRSTPLLPDTITELRFSNYENVSKTRVMRMTETGLEELKLDNAVGLKEKVSMKLDLLLNRYGVWPYFNIALILAIVMFMSILDIKKWYTGSTWRLIIESHFYILLGVNSLLILSLYIYMGETGAIRYDSVIAALIIAFAPIALLRTHFFETSTGKSIGIAKTYDDFLQWINDRLMIARHSRTGIYVNLIAFHNTVDGMRSYLRDIYNEQPSPERRIKLNTELAELVNDSLPYLQRRKVCARLLLRTKKWSELQLDAMAPGGELPPEKSSLLKNLLTAIKRWIRKQPKPINSGAPSDYLRDPEVVIKGAARHCAQDPQAKKNLDTEIENRLNAVSDSARRQTLSNALQQDLAGVLGEQAQLRRKLAFLFILRGYDEQFLYKLIDMQPEGQTAP